MTDNGASSLAGQFYTSEAIFAEEMERIFYRRWLSVGRAAEMAQAGEYRLRQVGDESIITVRDQQGTLRAFYNVCRHRGTRLCTAAAGRFPKTIQCPYHAWTYSLDGCLLGAPHMDEVATFDKGGYPLYSVAAQEWEGFLFINLSAGPEPFAQAYAPLMGKFDAWNLPGLQCLRRIEYDVRANWKLLFQNYSECYHCPGVHPALARLSPYRSGANDLDEGPFLGGPSRITREGGSLTMSGNRCSLPLGSLSGEDLNLVYYYTIFPNMFLSLHPDYVMVHTLWPQGPERTRIWCDWLFDAQAGAQPGCNPDDAVTLWDLTNRQDWEVCELTQQGIGSRAYTPGPYSTLESMPAAFEREYLRAIGDGVTR